MEYYVAKSPNDNEKKLFFLFMTILSQSLFTLVRGHFMALSLLS